MADIVYVVIYDNPTGAGALLKGVWRHYGGAEGFIDRQSDPNEYRIETEIVKEDES